MSTVERLVVIVVMKTKIKTKIIVKVKSFNTLDLVPGRFLLITAEVAIFDSRKLNAKRHLTQYFTERERLEFNQSQTTTNQESSIPGTATELRLP